MTTPGVRQIFKGTIRNPVSPVRVDSHEPGYLVVSGPLIEELTGEDPRPRFHDAEFIDCGNQIIVPGFVDTHVHLPQFRIMGTGAGELLSWLTNYTYPEESRFSDSRHASDVAAEFFAALVANGTTAAAIYSSVHEAASDIAFSTAQAAGV